MPKGQETTVHFDMLPSDGQLHSLITQVTIPDFENLVMDKATGIDLNGRFDEPSMRFIELSEGEREIVHKAEKEAWDEIYEHFEIVMSNQQIFSVNVDGYLHYVSVSSFDG